MHPILLIPGYGDSTLAEPFGEWPRGEAFLQEFL
jgi:hypothetical protein